MDFTTRGQEAIAAAQRSAVSAGHPALEPVHLLDALLAQPDGIALALLDTIGADRAALLDATDAAVARLPRASGTTVSGPQASGTLQRTLAVATERAQARGDAYLSTEHLLLGLAAAGAEAAEILGRYGATAPALADALDQVRGSARVASADPEGTFQALEKYGVDLTARAR